MLSLHESSSTQKTLNKIPTQVERHATGKKFLRLKAAAEQKRAETKEPEEQEGEEPEDDAQFWVKSE